MPDGYPIQADELAAAMEHLKEVEAAWRDARGMSQEPEKRRLYENAIANVNRLKEKLDQQLR